MQICFIGGGNIREEFDGMLSQFNLSIPPSHNVLIVPFATEPNKYSGWYHTIRQTFEMLGNHNVELLPYEMSSSVMADKISNQHVLFFTGGKPEKLLERLHTKDLIPVLNEFSGLMIGYSAGALAFCQDCIISKDADYPVTQVLKGLDLVDFSVEVHYTSEIDEELIPLSKDREIYALPNGAALFWNEGEINLNHDVYYFKDGAKIKLTLN
ncbi:peptidase E [Sporosarcina luteola]|nr:peptidase E [Sporosarcina luteola]